MVYESRNTALFQKERTHIMNDLEFEKAETNCWLLNIHMTFPDISKSEFKSIMKKSGMKYLPDFGEWVMNDFDMSKFQSWYLFTIKSFQGNVNYNKENQSSIRLINNLVISDYRFIAVEKDVIKFFCNWLKELSSYLNADTCILLECESVKNIELLEKWMNDACIFLEEKYYPCGTLGSEELRMSLTK